MKRLWLTFSVLLALALPLFFCGCTTTSGSRAGDGKPLFSKEMADTLNVGDATRDDVTVVLGTPYMKLPLTGDREQWVYMYTQKEHLIFTFDRTRVVRKEWSIQYGSPVEQ